MPASGRHLCGSALHPHAPAGRGHRRRLEHGVARRRRLVSIWGVHLSSVRGSPWEVDAVHEQTPNDLPTAEAAAAAIQDVGSRQVVVELAELVLQRTAPDEVPELPDVAEEYFADPQAVLAARRSDEPLGFGLELAMLAPIVLAIATPVVGFLVDVAKDLIKDAAKPHVNAAAQRLLRRPRQPPPAVTLSPQEAGTIRDSARSQAVTLGLSEQQAALLADAIVGCLAVGAPR